MQRIANNHTNYMVRARPKCKIDGEISKHWSANKRERLYEILYEYPIVGDYKGRTGLSPPTAYPQLWSTVTSEGFHAPGHHAHYKETIHIPWDSDPMDR